MPEQPPTPKVKLPMGQRKSGLSVPEEAVGACRHEAVMKRLKPQLPEYVCGDCDEKVLMVVLQFSLMTREIFDEFQKRQAAAFQAAQRRQRTGLITPDEARREQQEKKG